MPIVILHLFEKENIRKAELGREAATTCKEFLP